MQGDAASILEELGDVRGFCRVHGGWYGFSTSSISSCSIRALVSSYRSVLVEIRSTAGASALVLNPWFLFSLDSYSEFVIYF